MAKIGPNFRSESAHGSEIPWDGSEFPWDGSRETSHGCVGTPLAGAHATPGMRTATPAVLTVCQIAHMAARAAKARVQGKGRAFSLAAPPSPCGAGPPQHVRASSPPQGTRATQPRGTHRTGLPRLRRAYIGSRDGKFDPHGVVIVGWFLSAGSPAAHPRL